MGEEWRRGKKGKLRSRVSKEGNSEGFKSTVEPMGGAKNRAQL